MNENKFWELIERANEVSKGDADQKLEALKQEIEQLTPDEIVEYAKLFQEKEIKAYRWDLWAAAYVIYGGCGDDSFMDFRASLICMGKQIYENAVLRPDSLADVEFGDVEGRIVL